MGKASVGPSDDPSTLARPPARAARGTRASEPPSRKVADLIVACPTADLTRETGKHRNSIGRWRSGEALPRPEELAGISRALGIPLDRVRDAYTADYRDREARTKKRLP